ncbi:hypothetical protein PC9H_002600 [Pleurotus ostreatus]|uniref:Uncharacterized protein n=1 Tax=Pleurotus ostreatus TaxID=5322 RepID=A0A8H6ZH25_PLEOS|nr:uncharacterized protein PC9H_002600 [Pleurotus ostreatus]KAF7416335.1 hypothetical protein PC9H_002600 [Pleurotus ostreatus]
MPSPHSSPGRPSPISSEESVSSSLWDDASLPPPSSSPDLDAECQWEMRLKHENIHAVKHVAGDDCSYPREVSNNTSESIVFPQDDPGLKQHVILHRNLSLYALRHGQDDCQDGSFRHETALLPSETVNAPLTGIELSSNDPESSDSDLSTPIFAPGSPYHSPLNSPTSGQLRKHLSESSDSTKNGKRDRPNDVIDCRDIPKKPKANSSSCDISFAHRPASFRRALSLGSSCLHNGFTVRDPQVPQAPAKDVPKIRSKVPIIAPPLDHFARLPLSQEAEAKLRISRFLDSEHRIRDQDGLLPCYNDILQTRLDWAQRLGIGSDARLRALDWIFHASTDVCSSRPFSRNLRDQLIYSPETRFHAGYLFLRYFSLVEVEAEPANIPESQAALELVIFDAAVASLALSVKVNSTPQYLAISNLYPKLHLDTLWPLHPIMSTEYERLAPHEMSFDDLEASQRDLLSAFSFQLGSSPQLLLDQLWMALPSLRQVLDFTGGWTYAQKLTWECLYEALLQPDVLRYRLSLLTVAALIEALISTLELRYEFVEGWKGETCRSGKNKKQTHATHMQGIISARRGKATRTLEGVVLDIQAVTEITDDSLRLTREWLARMDSR